MTSSSIKIIVRADENLDDCLQGAADAYIAKHPKLAGWDLLPEWTDEDTRETVTLTVPVDSDEPATETSDDMVTLENMPSHLRASHRAAGNWGTYPANGATRERMTRADAEWEIEHDDDGYARIV